MQQLFLEHDRNHDEQLNEAEFIEFLKNISQRAVTTLVAHKFVTVVGAPLLPELAVKSRVLPRVFQFVLPTKLARRLATPTVCRSIWLLYFATTLADIVLTGFGFRAAKS